MELKRYPLSVLTLSRPEPRPCDDDQPIEKVIAERGVQFPVLVSPLAERLFDVIDGERRVAIARRLHARGKLSSSQHYVPCLVIAVQSRQERAMWRLICNLHRGLAADELVELGAESGMANIAQLAAATAGPGQEVVRDILDLQSGLCDRQTAIRGARRIMDVLEVARMYVKGGVGFQDAMDMLRRSEGE